MNNNSIEVLNNESDQLGNNLTIEHLGNLYQIADFREKLILSIGNLQIIEEERHVLKRVNEMRRIMGFGRHCQKGLMEQWSLSQDNLKDN